MPHIPCDALQLYTVRDLTAKDFAGTVMQIADIGYKYVEMAGYGNLGNAKAAKEALDKAGLKPISGHFGIDLLEKKLDEVIKDAETLGIDTIVCPYLAEERRKDGKAYEAVAKILEKIGSELHQPGYVLVYHNHNFEFDKFGGKTGLEIILENTSAHLVQSQIDVYWAKFASMDPAALIEKLGQRVRLLHLKDMAEGPDKHFAPVGTGIIDFKAILAAAEKSGVRAGIVEQDRTFNNMTPLEAIKISYDNLKKIGAI